MKQTKDPGEAAIRAALDDWQEGLAEKQARRVLSHYGAEPALFTLAPPLRTENDDDGSGLQDWFDTWSGKLSFEVRDLTIVAGSDVAFCHCLTRMSGTKVGGQENAIWFRQTLGLRREDGAWKIVHEHQSVPFYMDGSMKAAVDLQP
jgi:PhnB protein